MAQALSLGTNAADSVANYYYQHQQAPPSLAETGFSAPLPPFIKGIGVDSQNSIVTITMATGSIDGKTLLLVPSLDENKKIIWKCMSRDIQERSLPQQCRQPK